MASVSVNAPHRPHLHLLIQKKMNFLDRLAFFIVAVCSIRSVVSEMTCGGTDALPPHGVCANHGMNYDDGRDRYGYVTGGKEWTSHIPNNS